MQSKNMETRVFHIVFFDYELSAYVHFFDCNFRCKGCLRKLSIWDCHLPDEIISRLTLGNFLSLNDLRSILMKMISDYGMREVVLGGGEPTTDKNLVEIIKMLKRLNLEVVILTNAYKIDGDLMAELIDPRVTVIVSIKSIDPRKHEEYTGFPLEPVLKNFIGMRNSGVKLVVETIAIPGFNDPCEIGELARFISSVDENIPLLIDSFIPVPGAPWRRTTIDETEEAVRAASTYLKNVYNRGKAIAEGIKGGVHLIYPQP